MIRKVIKNIIISTTRPYLKVIQNIIISTTRPYISRELPGWDRVFGLFEYQDWLWATAPMKMTRAKFHDYILHLNLAEWADRKTYFLNDGMISKPSFS